MGRSDKGQLGLGEAYGHNMLPAYVGGREVFDGEPVIMAAAGTQHSAGVSKDGVCVKGVCLCVSACVC